MKNQHQIRFAIPCILLMTFILFTASLMFFDLEPIGPKGSIVAYASINGPIHRLIGVRLWLYSGGILLSSTLDTLYYAVTNFVMTNQEKLHNISG